MATEPNWDQLREKVTDLMPGHTAIAWGVQTGIFECDFCRAEIGEAAVFAVPDEHRNFTPVHLCPDSDACDLRSAVRTETVLE